MSEPVILQSGDRCLVVEFSREISDSVNAAVHSFDAAVKEKRIKGVTETVPTFRSLSVFYNPLEISSDKLRKKLRKLFGNVKESAKGAKRIIEIPVLYGGEYGEDLKDVAEYTGLSEAEVIRLHSGTDYLIYMLGFLPGFAYLGGMDKRLNTPRLKSPRTKIHTGAVGIGGEQTGIYPLDSPGGWRLIGTTPLKPYDSERTPEFLYSAGEYIRFVPIDEPEFKRIAELVKSNEYTPKIIEEK